MKAIYAISYIEAWKSQKFDGVWTRDLTIPLPRSNQLSYEATDVGSWSFVGPKELKRKKCSSYNMTIFPIYWIADGLVLDT